MKIVYPSRIPLPSDRIVQRLSPTLNLVLNEPLPVPSGREVLIRVVAASLNRMNLMQANGPYPLPAGASEALGVEVAGTIMALGPDCELFAIDDEVCALLPGGGYAEYAVCDERTAIRSLRFKHSLTIHQIASIPEAFMTAYQLLFFVANIEANMTSSTQRPTILIHAAASSVGQALIQIGKRAGLNVFATARDDKKCAFCLKLGASNAFLVPANEAPSFAQSLKSANGGRGCDLILCPVGSHYFNENIESLEMDGKLILYGLMGGSAVHDDVILRKLMARRISIMSSTLRSRDVEYKARLIKALSSDDAYGEGGVFGSISRGDIVVNVDSVFELEDAAQAHDLMSQNKNTGKIVLNTLSSASGVVMMKKEVDDMIKRMTKPV